MIYDVRHRSAGDPEHPVKTKELPSHSNNLKNASKPFLFNPPAEILIN